MVLLVVGGLALVGVTAALLAGQAPATTGGATPPAPQPQPPAATPAGGDLGSLLQVGAQTVQQGKQLLDAAQAFMASGGVAFAVPAAAVGLVVWAVADQLTLANARREALAQLEAIKAAARIRDMSEPGYYQRVLAEIDRRQVALFRDVMGRPWGITSDNSGGGVLGLSANAEGHLRWNVDRATDGLLGETVNGGKGLWVWKSQVDGKTRHYSHERTHPAFNGVEAVPAAVVQLQQQQAQQANTAAKVEQAEKTGRVVLTRKLEDIAETKGRVER